MATTKAVPTTKGAVLATEASGEPSKGTILLVMGATASMVWWPESLIQILAEAGYRAIRFDHRDTGRSTTNMPGDLRYDLFDMVDDVFAVLDAYGAERAHLVGMSLGGLLSQIAALQQPGRIASLTLIASEPLGLEYEGEGISSTFMEHFGAMEQLNWDDQVAVADYLVRSAELCAGTAVPFAMGVARKRAELELQRSSSIQSAFNHGSVTGDLDGLSTRNLNVPVQVIHGNEDPIIALAAGFTIVEAVPGAKLMVLDRRGHELLDQDIPAIARAILDVAT